MTQTPRTALSLEITLSYEESVDYFPLDNSTISDELEKQYDTQGAFTVITSMNDVSENKKINIYKKAIPLKKL